MPGWKAGDDASLSPECRTSMRLLHCDAGATLSHKRQGRWYCQFGFHFQSELPDIFNKHRVEGEVDPVVTRVFRGCFVPQVSVTAVRPAKTVGTSLEFPAAC